MRTPLPVRLTAASTAVGALAALATVAPALAPAAAAPPAAAAASAFAHVPSTTYGLTLNGRLVRFPIDAPRASQVVGQISGFAPTDSELVGIDFRVQNGKLYGVGDRGGIYTINRRTAELTLVTQLTVPLGGTQFGVDFNPAANALRIVSNTSQNLRHSFVTFTTTMDGNLTYGDPPGPAEGIAMAAYTNNDLDLGTGVTLFDVDTRLDQVVTQAPANNGTLQMTGTLGLDVGPRGGFDIYSALDDDGRTTRNSAYAVFRTDARGSALYDVKALTGEKELVDEFRDRQQVFDLAIKLAGS